MHIIDGLTKWVWRRAAPSYISGYWPITVMTKTQRASVGVPLESYTCSTQRACIGVPLASYTCSLSLKPYKCGYSNAQYWWLTKVSATQSSTIIHIGILANNMRVMTKTHTRASPKFRHNSKPITSSVSHAAYTWK